MEVDRPDAYAPLKIKGLSYADWEDEADKLRQSAMGRTPLRKRDVTRTQDLLKSLDEELEAIDRVDRGLTGIDAIRVSCVRALVIALRASLAETLRRLEERAAKRSARPARKRAATA
jgi:hypothetical protein